MELASGNSIRKERISFSSSLVKHLPSKQDETIAMVYYTFDYFVHSIPTGSRLLEISSYTKYVWED